MNRSQTHRWRAVIVGTLAFSLLSYASFAFLGRTTILDLSREDGFFESMGAVGLFLAAVLCLVLFLRSSRGNDFGILRTRRNFFFLFLAILFFFGGGEEISWGQRIFGFGTPPYLEHANRQHEFNVHNLRVFASENDPGYDYSGWKKLFSMEFSFTLFWLGYCVAIPLVCALRMGCREFFARINLPLVPLWISFLFVLNHLGSKFVEWMMRGRLERSIVEVKECNFELLLFIAAAYFAGQYTRHSSDRKNTPDRTRHSVARFDEAFQRAGK